MDKRFDKTMIYAAYAYIIFPFLLFLLCWLRWYYALTFSAVIILSTILSLRQHEQSGYIATDLKKHARKIGIALAIIIIVVLFSGIGSYSYQNEDYELRNGILSDLVTHSWPLRINETGNIPGMHRPFIYAYYISFWFPAALLGKVMGITAARFFLFLWTVAGVALIFYFLCRMFRRVSIRLLLIFLLFDGLYLVGAFMKMPAKNIVTDDYVLWAGNMLLANSSLSSIYWIFNQTIVPWLITMLILNHIPRRNMIFLYALIYMNGPFFFIGLFPYIVYMVLKDAWGSGRFFKTVWSYFSFQNVAGSLVAIVPSYFFLACSPGVQSLFIQHGAWRNYALLVILSFGIIAALIFGKYRKEPLFYITVFMLLLLPRVGMGNIQPFTFCARVSLAPMFMLMLLTARYFFEEKNGLIKKAVVVYLVICTIDPILTFGRSVVFTTKWYMNPTAMNKYLYERSGQWSTRKAIVPQPPASWEGENFLIQNDMRSVDSPKNPNNPTYVAIQDHHYFFEDYLMRRK